jgi:hypothetical protein
MMLTISSVVRRVGLVLGKILSPTQALGRAQVGSGPGLSPGLGVYFASVMRRVLDGQGDFDAALTFDACSVSLRQLVLRQVLNLTFPVSHSSHLSWAPSPVIGTLFSTIITPEILCRAWVGLKSPGLGRAWT